MNPDNGNRHYVNHQLSRARHEAGRKSPLDFARIYLPGRINVELSSMHVELLEMFTQASEKRGQHVAIAAPRGSGKTTTITEICIIWSLVYGLEKYIFLISRAKEQAGSTGFESIKGELEHNPLLIQDFPDVCWQPQELRQRKPWRGDDLVLKNGCRLSSFGVCQQIRGRKHAGVRPTAIFYDDLEDVRDVRSADQRATLLEWFQRTAQFVGTGFTNHFVLGMRLHHDSLLSTLSKHPAWTYRGYAAIVTMPDRLDLWSQYERIYNGLEQFQGELGAKAADKFYEANRVELDRGGKSLWPQRWTVKDLMTMRMNNSLAFDPEMMNQPINTQDCFFPIDRLHWWDGDGKSLAQLLTQLRGRSRIYCACDPSMGRIDNRGDYTAIITGIQDIETRFLYIIDADIQRGKPDETIKAILDKCRAWEVREVVVEGNSFQELYAKTLRETARAQNIRVNVEEVRHSMNKVGRIQGMQPLILGGHVLFSRCHTLLIEQLTQFPMAAHDDAADALEMLVEHAMNTRKFLYTPSKPRKKSWIDQTKWFPTNRLVGWG